jgi:hypothetical protein
MKPICLSYKVCFLIVLFAIWFTTLIAQDVTVSAYVDKNRVVVGEQFRLVIEAKGESIGSMPAPELPPMSFTAMGSSRSSSTNVTLTGGRMVSQKTEAITIILRADTQGTFRIPPISVVVDRREYLTRPIDITVLENTQQATPPTTGGAQASTPTNQGTPQSTPATFLLATVDKRNVFKNEMIVVHYKLYTQQQIQNVSLGAEPAFTGFWKEELFQADRLQMQREIYEGKQYNTLLLRSLALFPSREGALTIPAFDVNLDIVIPARSFFDFGSVQSTRVSSRPINITVNPLPSVDPAQNFIGGVGRYSVTSSISGNEVDAGGSLTYRITLSGSGNFNQTTSPRMPEIQGVRFLNPETDDTRNRSGTEFSGRRTFIYPIIFQESGTVVIPESQISWFDPSARRYVTHTLPAQSIIVNPSAQQIVATPGSQQTIRVLGRDIEFIITNLSTRNFHYLYQKFWYWLLCFALVLSLILHYIYILDLERQSTDTLYRRNRRATTLIRKYLKEASQHARKNEIEFYDSAYIGLTQFLTDKLNLPRGSVERVIYEALQENNVSMTLIDDLEKYFQKINLIKYANANVDSVDIKADFQTIENLINGIVAELNKKKK